MSKTAESLTHPAYGQLRAVTDTASVLLADNPGLLTLDGTNTWVLRGPLSDELVVVDPGPDDDEHLARVAALGRIALVLISHRHGDHTSGIDKLVALTGAPVRAADPQFLRRDGETLTDGEVIDVAGLTITVLATPGHTADSLSFVLDDAVLTADTVLGCGTTVIDKEDGSLADYLESLHRLRGLGRRTVLPGHGPDLLDLEAIASGYLLHRHERLEQIRAALQDLGDDATVREVVEHVYLDVDEKLWNAAEWSVQAQLDYLRTPVARAAAQSHKIRRLRATLCLLGVRKLARSVAPALRALTSLGGPVFRSQRSAHSCPQGGSSRGERNQPVPCSPSRVRPRPAGRFLPVSGRG